MDLNILIKSMEPGDMIGQKEDGMYYLYREKDFPKSHYKPFNRSEIKLRSEARLNLKEASQRALNAYLDGSCSKEHCISAFKALYSADKEIIERYRMKNMDVIRICIQ